MENLTPLVREYKKTNNPVLMTEICNELTPLIKQKANFIFYKKYYPLSLYNKCYSCQICDNKSKSNCKLCKKCSCIKGTFNLKKSGLCELEDVESDLWVEVLRIIKNYDVTKDFDTYLYSSIWDVRPSFITMDFIKSLQEESFLEESDTELPQTENVIDNSTDILEKNSKIELIFKSCKSEIELKILKLVSSGHNQKEIAKKLNVSFQYVYSLLEEIKDRVKKTLKDEE